MLKLALILMGLVAGCAPSYVGRSLGRLNTLEHDVKGEVFAVDSRTLHIRGFSYDGRGPDAFFYGGKSGTPSEDGFIIPDENGSEKPLGAYRSKDVTLTLPKGVSVKDLRWVSIWCRRFSVDFGNLLIPRGVQYPRPQKIGAFKTLDHDVKSGPIVVVDAQTFLIPNFSYDGTAPGSYEDSDERESKSPVHTSSSHRNRKSKHRSSSRKPITNPFLRAASKRARTSHSSESVEINQARRHQRPSLPNKHASMSSFSRKSAVISRQSASQRPSFPNKHTSKSSFSRKSAVISRQSASRAGHGTNSKKKSNSRQTKNKAAMSLAQKHFG